jgi:hypothetical protein
VRNAPRPTVYGLGFHAGCVTVVGRAEPELDHGQPFWLCQTLPPNKQVFEPASTEQEAAAWLRKHAGATTVVVGTELLEV